MKDSDKTFEGGREREQRIEKLDRLREMGIEPYPMMSAPASTR